MATQLTKLREREQQLLKEEQQLREQLRDLKARQRDLEDRDNAKRQHLIGACIQQQIAEGKLPEQQLLQMMDSFLSKVTERELFGLNKRGGA